MPAKRKFLSSLFIFFIVGVLFLFWPKVIFAKRAVVINSFKNTLVGEEQFNVSVGIDGFVDGEKIYFKGAFAPPQSTNYFGYTLENGEWIKNSETATAQFEAIIGVWNQILTVKPDLSDTSFNGPGSYNFKVGFYYYTTTGNISSVNWSDIVSITITEPSPSPTPIPSPAPTLVPTSTPKPPTSTPTPKPMATYKINEVRDEDEEILNNVKVYVDGVYLHHYAPEVLTFCDDCRCDTYVDCGFGQHIIKLEKTGYEDWIKTITIDPDTNDGVNPVMVFLESTSTPTPTSSPTPTPKQTVTSLTPKPTSKTASESGEVLGEEVATLSAFYSYEATEGAGENEATSSAKNKLWPKIFLGVGLLLVFASAFWGWYNFHK